jgi:hypothetical protein
MPEFAKVLDFTDGGHVQPILKEANLDLLDRNSTPCFGLTTCVGWIVSKSFNDVRENGCGNVSR